jgi:succinate-semialdehyde dehydrogenase/glutarate-semialdehyde dehydrogenase
MSIRYFTVNRRSTAALVCTMNGNNTAAAAFSTLASMLSDPSLLGDDPRAHGGGGGGADDDDGASYFDVVDPGSSTGRDVIGRVRRMGRDDARLAIGRAGSALAGWRDGATASRRSGLLSAWSALVRENSEDIAAIMTMESGKPLHESRGEVAYGASFLDYYAAEAVRANSAGGGTICPTPFAHAGTGAPRGRILATNEAVGVCGLITPWNFPLAMITRKAGPALAAGCTVVLKPSDLTPLTAVALAVLAERAGIPRGVFEVVTADASSTGGVGEEMCTNATVRKVSFTGSTPVGKLLMKLSSDTVKRLSLELGGNAAFIGEPRNAVSSCTLDLKIKTLLNPM